MAKKLIMIILMCMFLSACGKNEDVSSIEPDTIQEDILSKEVEDSDGIEDEHAVNISCDNGSITFTITDVHVAELANAGGTANEMDYNFYLYFYKNDNPTGGGNGACSEMKIYPSMAYYVSNELADAAYNDNGDIVEGTPVWGYSVDNNSSSQEGSLIFDGDCVKVTFWGLNIADTMEGVETYALGFFTDSAVSPDGMGHGEDIEMASIEAIKDGSSSNYEAAPNLDLQFCMDAHEDIISAKLCNEEIVDFLTENKGEEYVGIDICLYADESSYSLDRYEWNIHIGKYDYDIFEGDYCAKLEQYAYDEDGVQTSIYIENENPVTLKDGVLSFKIKYDNIKDIIGGQRLFKIVKRSTDANSIVMAGEVESTMASEVLSAEATMPEEYVNPKDEDFFIPKTEYYHVYSQEYPIVYVAKMGWLYDSMVGAYGYGPASVEATSAKITYLESYDEFGEIIQSVGRIEYGKENAALTAFVNRYSFYYPDDGGMDTNSVPSDYFHENLVYYLDYLYDMGDCLVSYDSDVMYFDFMPYFDRNNYGTDMIGEGAYFRYSTSLEPVRSLAAIWSDDSGLDFEYLKELDKKGELDDTFEYYFEMDDIIEGETFWSGTYTAYIHGFSTAGEVMGE